MIGQKVPYYQCDVTKAVVLTSPLSMPKAAGFLWNKKMMLQMNCRGYAVAQFMQPEPTKYSTGPSLEATTFMQPEHHYHAQHPGRFFYVKSHNEDQLYSLPFEPVRHVPAIFEFHILEHALVWKIRHGDLFFELKVELVPDRGAELWTLRIENVGETAQKFELYPCFSIGFLSWMNQSADFNEQLNGIVGNKITPYQKLADYYRNKHLKERTFLLADAPITSWCANAESFEGLGGLHNPDGIVLTELNRQSAKYEVPIAVLQQSVELERGSSKTFRYLFGAESNEKEISALKNEFLTKQGATRVSAANAIYNTRATPALKIKTPDQDFDRFVNQWLPRQAFYHGDVNRLTTDPQTRNYLQDAMGMAYLGGRSTREALAMALSQQNSDGSMPDGVLLHVNAELKYINQIPHSDHCVWLPICLKSYLNETDDSDFLEEPLPFADKAENATVAEHLDLAMQWLKANLDDNGLSLIQQGDWCDPMNMVGHKGKGVSAWLTMATSYAWIEWASICRWVGDSKKSVYWQHEANAMNSRGHKAFWKDKWFARGITDDGRLFGTEVDNEGKMYLNPQSWAMLSGMLPSNEAQSLIEKVKQNLDTPYGPVMLSPAYTEMVEDIGRMTQKYPGSAENGSVYNHAAAFYGFALYQYGFANEGFKVLKKMLVTPEDVLQRGQLPVFIPNYYRGAWKENPSHAGRSSQLFNTGTTAWFYRTLVEGLFGLSGNAKGLHINPQLPDEWDKVSVTRRFRGARFVFDIQKDPNITEILVFMDGNRLSEPLITDIEANKHYAVTVKVPL
ncbi:NdvB protein [Alteromonas sp. 5E99-2]|uniref:GH36-type glycosyl hydrolase domain-containing protein n=1 Tax=Alteromonas sp. 5E99-2 TaxID=2817683 RepID=UPI001A98B16D|nr:NdvB protein [Alteromonas sp. 5E99-2]MBO1255926.1 NdvB protein [Alteromonas sp. 5E99-2]